MTELDQARQEINQLNQQLVELLEARFTAVTKINDYKAAHQLPILDSQREQAILKAVHDKVRDPQKGALHYERFSSNYETITAVRTSTQKGRLTDELYYRWRIRRTTINRDY